MGLDCFWPLEGLQKLWGCDALVTAGASMSLQRCKLALLNCGVFLGWPHLKLMFRSMAWEDTWSCLVNVWNYLVSNPFPVWKKGKHCA